MGRGMLDNCKVNHFPSRVVIKIEKSVLNSYTVNDMGIFHRDTQRKTSA